MILAGMGGSGHPGDLLNALGITTKPLYVHRNYDLPLQYLGNMGFTKTLFIASSYSGNTEEPLTGYELAREKNIPILASAAGGQLEEQAHRDNVPFCTLDYPDMQPRHTLFAAFTGIYTALRNSNLVKNIDEDLQRVAEVIHRRTPELERPAQELAQKIKGKVPVFSSGDSLGFATKNFKIQVNENAKYPAFWSTFPELNHNEMTGFGNAKLACGEQTAFHVLLIHDENENDHIKSRIATTGSLYKKWGVEVSEFTAEGDSLLEKLFQVITFGLWTSYFLALEYDVDPIPVPAVEEFKAEHARNVGKTS